MRRRLLPSEHMGDLTWGVHILPRPWVEQCLQLQTHEAASRLFVVKKLEMVRLDQEYLLLRCLFLWVRGSHFLDLLMFSLCLGLRV